MAAQRAYNMAGTAADQIDLAEVHDCFTIAEVLATEDLGFADRGKGGQFAREGRGALNQGETTINSSGGLKSKGHPLGATGTGQVVEVFKQLLEGRWSHNVKFEMPTSPSHTTWAVREPPVRFTCLGGIAHDR